MRILIADDHKILLEGLKILLSSIDFITHVNTADHINDLNTILHTQLIDVILLDIRFGQVDGRECCRQIKKEYPNIKLIAFTSHDDINTIKSALQAGFDGYLLKSEDKQSVEQALKAVAGGQQYFSPLIKEVFFMKSTMDKNVELTKREIEILTMIVDEKTTKEIAAALFISDKTVENHRTNLMLKLDVKNMAGLVKKAILLGYVS